MTLESLAEWIWVVPLLPLAGAAILLFFGRRIGDPMAGWLATMLLGLAFVVSAVASVPFFTGVGEPQLVTWRSGCRRSAPRGNSPGTRCRR